MEQNKPLLVLLPIFCWGLVFYAPLMDMATVWGQSKTYEHGYLIAPISLWVAWQHRQQISQLPRDVAWLPILLMPIPGMLWLVGKAGGVALFEHAAAIFSLQLLLWAMLGTPRAKVMWFPIAYLTFCIPFGEELIPSLQTVTADLSIVFLQLSGIPVYRDGWYLTIPNGQFFVAEACSGIRFLISSVALGTLFAYLQFTKPWKRILFVGFSFIFPIIANGIRAYGIILIGYLSDMKHATGADHLVYGWVFFSLVILCIYLTASLFADKQREQETVSPQPHPSGTSPVKAIGLLSALLLCFALWGRSMTAVPDPVTDTSPLLAGSVVTQSVSHLPSPPDTKPATSLEMEKLWGIQFPHASIAKLAVSTDGNALLYTARYALWQPEGELISSDNQLFDKEKWAIQRSGQLSLQTDTSAATLSLTNQRGDTMQVVYWYCISEFCSSDPLTIKLYKAGQLIRGGSGYADVFAIASSDDQQAAHFARLWSAATNAEADVMAENLQ